MFVRELNQPPLKSRFVRNNNGSVDELVVNTYLLDHLGDPQKYANEVMNSSYGERSAETGWQFVYDEEWTKRERHEAIKTSPVITGTTTTGVKIYLRDITDGNLSYILVKSFDGFFEEKTSIDAIFGQNMMELYVSAALDINQQETRRLLAQSGLSPFRINSMSLPSSKKGVKQSSGRYGMVRNLRVYLLGEVNQVIRENM